MDVLNRILELKIERSWTQYRLSVRSGIPTSDISVWYGRRSTPNPTTLEKVCKAFDISMAEFFCDDKENVVTLTPEERILMESTLRLTANQREELNNLLELLLTDKLDTE